MPPNHSVVTLRLPASLLARVDKLLPELEGHEQLMVVGKVTRSVALRLAILRGLEQLEEEHGSSDE